jgi:hypothetical protein
LHSSRNRETESLFAAILEAANRILSTPDSGRIADTRPVIFQ